MQSNDVSDIIKNITDDVKILVHSEIELAKAELIPSGKKAGVGAGMFGAAGYVGVNAASLLFLAGAALIAWIFNAALGLSIFPSAAIGLAIMALILGIVAAVLAMQGKKNIAKVSGPDRTVAQGKAAVEDVKAAVDRGQAEVASGEVLERHNEARELASSARRSADLTQPASNGWHRLDQHATDTRTGGSTAAR